MKLDPRPPLASRRQALASAGATALVCAMPGAARAAIPSRGLDSGLLDTAVARASALPRLHTLQVARDGEALVAQAFRGPGLDRMTNVKSVSKSVISALAGVAIERGILAGVDQPIVSVLGDLPAAADARVNGITVGHLLSMRAGLERTSGRNYGAWVNSANWVDYALSRPFVDQPGGRMLYSTGSYHLLSALLTEASGTSTLALARDWLGKPLGIEIPPWTKDPQGIYLGGNNMALTPRALLRFGELYRRGGVWESRRVLPADWIDASWSPRTRSPFTGHSYGYGWFLASARGYGVSYAWGFGGQIIYVVPDLALTVVMTSDHSSPAGRSGYLRELHGLFSSIVQAAERGVG